MKTLLGHQPVDLDATSNLPVKTFSSSIPMIIAGNINIDSSVKQTQNAEWHPKQSWYDQNTSFSNQNHWPSNVYRYMMAKNMNLAEI